MVFLYINIHKYWGIFLISRALQRLNKNIGSFNGGKILEKKSI